MMCHLSGQNPPAHARRLTLFSPITPITMQTIASRSAIIGQRVTARPSGKTSKSAVRQPIKVNAVQTLQSGKGIMVDPDQYDDVATGGRGSGFVAGPPAPASFSSASYSAAAAPRRRALPTASCMTRTSTTRTRTSAPPAPSTRPPRRSSSRTFRPAGSAR